MSIYDKYKKKDDDDDVLVRKENIYNKYKEPENVIPSGPYAGQRAIIEMVKNTPESAANLIESLYTAVTNPIETAEAVGETAKGFGNKLGRTAAEFIHGQEMEPMPERSEVAADVVIEGIKEDYGSPKAIIEKIISDPVGTAFDVGGVGGSVIKPLRAIDPLEQGIKGGKKASGKAGEKLYERSLDMPPSTPAADKAANVRTGLDRGIVLNPKGYESITSMKDAIADDINRYINYSNATSVPVVEITKYFDDVMRSLEGKSGGAKKIAEVKKYKNELLDKDFAGRNDISIQDLQDFKTDLYGQVYTTKSKGTAKELESGRYKAEKQAARAAKEKVNKEAGVEPLNEEWGKLAELDPIVQARIDRASKMEPGFARWAYKALSHPGTSSRIAIAMDKIAKGDYKWLENSLNSRELRLALVMSGRNMQQLQEETERVGQ